MSDNCLFCRIVAGEIPANIVAQNELAIAFRDIAPQAPVHVLVVPRRHVQSLAHGPTGAELAAISELAIDIAKTEGLDSGGYRTVTNVGRDGGQSVDHLHLHLLGGRQMKWPPG